ncbi:MAG: DUF2339 domain-containing protein [Chitinophagaceae bacterium]|nr:DUF2339 domain-containing protein [Chitinophagaceae bacterium]
MDGLIVLAFLIPAFFVIAIIILLVKSSAQQRSLNEINDKLQQLMKQSERKTIAPEKVTEKEVTPVSQFKKTEDVVPQPKPAYIQPKEEPAKPAEEVKPVEEPKPQAQQPLPAKETVEKPMPVFEAPKKTSEIDKLIHESLKQKAAPQQKTDWEKVIGENLANKIGIGILVLGISFFVKYAIDNNWINEAGRVIVGLLCGGLLIGIAHYFRNSYRSFSSVLVGGGIAVFYFTIAYAFHQYKLLSVTSAFVIMVVITVFAVFLSLLYNRLELAVLATLGGYLTPFLVSTGQNNYVELFTYLCILNTGLLALAYFKKWKAINIIALISTILIFGGWLTKQSFAGEPFPYKPALLFAIIFYVQFFIMNIINNVRLKLPFKGFDFALLLSINLLLYAAGYFILGYWNDGSYRGLFTASLGIVNLAVAWMFFKNNNVDRNFIYLLIGLTLTFISLTAPVQLKGNHITLFWSAEMVVLFWLFQRSGIRLLKITSLLISFLVLISLLIDWNTVYADPEKAIPILANKAFTTALFAGIALLLYYLLLKKENETNYIGSVSNKAIRNYLLITGVAVVYLSGALEIIHQFDKRVPLINLGMMYLQLYSFAFAVAVMYVFKKASSFILLKFALTIMCVLLYVYGLNINYKVSLQMLQTGAFKNHFWAHWVAAALLFWLLYDLILYFRKNREAFQTYETAFTWIAAVGMVFLMSVEMYHVIMWMKYSQGTDTFYWENLYYKAGLSIVWGVCSFAMIWLGMKYKFKTLRIISLSLFTLTLVKLFLYDIRNIPAGGKIAAFILLGVLLLVISFMYQRLKKLITDDEKKAEDNS